MLLKTSVNLEKILDHYLDWILNFSGRAIVAIFILGIGFKLVKAAVNFLKRGMERRQVDYGVVTFSCSFTKIALRGVVIFMAVQELGVEGSSVIALLGSAGVAVGLALQGESFRT